MDMRGSQRAIPAASVIWPSRSKPDFNLECGSTREGMGRDKRGEGFVGGDGGMHFRYDYSCSIVRRNAAATSRISLLA